MKTFIVLVTVLLSSAGYADTCSRDPAPVPKAAKKHVPKKRAVHVKTITMPELYLVGTASKYPYVPESCPIGYVTNRAQPAPAETDPDLILGGRLALGFGPRVPVLTALAGLRLHYLPWHLGAEGYTLFNHGWGGQVLFYPYQGKKVYAHVNAGLIADAAAKLSTQDLPRAWDVTLGAGLEYRLFKHLSLVGDYRLAFPSPAFVVGHNGPVYAGGRQLTGEAGRYLDLKHVFGNSLTQSQVLLGIMFRN